MGLIAWVEIVYSSVSYLVESLDARLLLPLQDWIVNLRNRSCSDNKLIHTFCVIIRGDERVILIQRKIGDRQFTLRRFNTENTP
jgi:hypothetical protein